MFILHLLVKKKFIKIFELNLNNYIPISGDKTRGAIINGDSPIPLDIDGNLFQFEM